MYKDPETILAILSMIYHKFFLIKQRYISMKLSMLLNIIIIFVINQIK